MKPSEIEAWALQTVHGLRAARNVEDARVELKQEWIPAEKAARRIAGHLNASGGDVVLWLFGVSEAGVVQATQRDDFAEWWPKVLSHFDGPTPQVTDVVVHHEDALFVAVLFSGVQPPYVVRNPSFGTASGGPVELEVPWREMTRVRTARHGDLLRLLYRPIRLPEIEVVDASILAEGEYIATTGARKALTVGQKAFWNLTIDLYCVPPDERPIVLPIHRTTLVIDQPEPIVSVPLRVLSRSLTNPAMLDSSRDHAVSGPGRLEIMGSAEIEHHYQISANEILVELRARPAWVSKEFVARIEFDVDNGATFRYRTATTWWDDF